MATKTVLITGTSAGGIGSALAFAFQKRGLRVFATARNTSKIDPALADLPNVELLSLDVTSDASIAAAVVEVKERTSGKLDFLVNNSGLGYIMPFLDLDMDEAKKLFDVNFWGVLAATKAFAPMLIEAKGAIVNISSIAAVAYSPYEIIYNSSKAAITMFSDTLRMELAPMGVKVISVMTGLVKTNWYNNVPTFILPSDSLYLPVVKHIEAGATGVSSAKNGTPANVYAESVVKHLLGGANGRIWHGALSTLVWSLSLLPYSIMDYVMMDRSGLKGLKRSKNN